MARQRTKKSDYPYEVKEIRSGLFNDELTYWHEVYVLNGRYATPSDAVRALEQSLGVSLPRMTPYEERSFGRVASVRTIKRDGCVCNELLWNEDIDRFNHRVSYRDGRWEIDVWRVQEPTLPIKNAPFCGA